MSSSVRRKNTIRPDETAFAITVPSAMPATPIPKTTVAQTSKKILRRAPIASAIRGRRVSPLARRIAEPKL